VHHWNGKPVSGFVESGTMDQLLDQIIAVGAAAGVAFGMTALILVAFRLLAKAITRARESSAGTE
jgi:hypothetical protein